MPHLTQTYIDCICQRVTLPPENAFVQVEGVWTPHKRRKRATTGEGWIFLVNTIKLKDDQYLRLVKPDITYNEFEASIFDAWEGIDPLVKRYLAKS
jgi:hypothetical protein